MTQPLVGFDQFKLVSDSQKRVISAIDSGRVNAPAVHSLADFVAISAFDLIPQPIELVDHLRFDYGATRKHLEHLTDHDPTTIATISNADGYVYRFTPRKVLRRVLDHAIDHFNQIDQWLAWRSNGIKPAPTDGWASSADQLEEDTLPISQIDLGAWLWRTDLVWDIVTRRAGELADDELDRTPPDDGWTLRQTLHHLAAARFYVFWLDNALPEAAVERYAEASRRLRVALERFTVEPLPSGMTFYASTDQAISAQEIIERILSAESAFLAVAA